MEIVLCVNEVAGWSPLPINVGNDALSVLGFDLCYGLPWWLSGKESACHCRRAGFNPWVRKLPWRRKWQPTPVFLLEEFHGQRILPGYSP